MAPSNQLIWIFFVYGLAFFGMGLAILLEIGHISDRRLRYALRFLAVFGLVHGIHEWMEMFHLLGISPLQALDAEMLDAVRVFVLAFSFLALATFGVALLLPGATPRRWSFLIPGAGLLVWTLGMLVLVPRYGEAFWHVADVWTRYSLAIPSALLACAGLIGQKRVFREAGMAEFGQDSLWAAIAFAWYGAIGQAFVATTPLPPSNIINNALFTSIFGFPVQLLRATAAVVVAVFVLRFLRSSEVEQQRKMAQLQAERLGEAERREALRGELLMRVVEAQEAERQRIARELHDETGQSLTAIALGLRGTSRNLPENPSKARDQVQRLEDLTARSLVDLQRIVLDLRPSHLDDLGLPATLRWYAGELGRRANLQVTVVVDGEERRLPTEKSTALFRIAQEALTNTTRHAQVQAAIVQLTYLPDSVCLVILDEGVGFDPAAVKRLLPPAWGLMGMQERAGLLGGKLVIDSAPSGGTSIAATIPFHPGEEVSHADSPAAG
jgi:signal transduction histidine kinase